jgi:hypothetical protein
LFGEEQQTRREAKQQLEAAMQKGKEAEKQRSNSLCIFNAQHIIDLKKYR